MDMQRDDTLIETVEVDGAVVTQEQGTFAALGQPGGAEGRRLTAALPRQAKADDIIKVSQFAWDIIKDSKAEAATAAACSRILCAKDDHWENYGGAHDFESKRVTLKLDNFAKVNCYTVTFKIAGTYQASHPHCGGLWIPNVHVTFLQCDANWPWILNGTASIDGTYVSNMGTVDNPIPQVVLVIKIVTNARVAFNWESHEKTFEFTLNGRDGVKQV